MATSPQTQAPPPGPDRQRLLARETASEAAFRRDYPGVWWGSLLGPLFVTAGILVYLGVKFGGSYLLKFVLTALVTFFLAGRFIILTGMEPGQGTDLLLTRGQLFAMVVYMDMLCACLMVFHMGFLFNLPWLGPRLLALAEDGRFILDSNRWIRRAAFVGLVAFVTFPLAATGSIGGAVFGRLLGMSRPATFLGVTVGSLLGCGVMYFGNTWINRYVDRDNPFYTIAGFAVIAALVFLLNYRYRKLKARQMKQEG